MIRMLFIIVFFVVILMFLAGFSVFRTFKNIFFGNGSNQKTTNQQRKTTRNTNSQQRAQQEYNAAPRKKIFTKEEGEYVEYEEVKSNEDR